MPRTIRSAGYGSASHTSAPVAQPSGGDAAMATLVPRRSVERSRSSGGVQTLAAASAASRGHAASASATAAAVTSVQRPELEQGEKDKRLGELLHLAERHGLWDLDLQPATRALEGAGWDVVQAFSRIRGAGSRGGHRDRNAADVEGDADRRRARTHSSDGVVFLNLDPMVRRPQEEEVDHHRLQQEEFLSARREESHARRQLNAAVNEEAHARRQRVVASNEEAHARRQRAAAANEAHARRQRTLAGEAVTVRSVARAATAHSETEVRRAAIRDHRAGTQQRRTSRSVASSANAGGVATDSATARVGAGPHAVGDRAPRGTHTDADSRQFFFAPRSRHSNAAMRSVSSGGESEQEDDDDMFFVAAQLLAEADAAGFGRHFGGGHLRTAEEVIEFHGTAALVSSMLQMRDEADLQDAIRRSTEEAYSGGFSVPPADEAVLLRASATSAYAGPTPGQQPGQCAICLGDYECGDPLRTLQCGHNFHMMCVDTWLAQSGQCPVCKQRIGDS